MSASQDRKLPKLIIILLIILVASISLICAVITRNAPTSQHVNLAEYYKAESNSAAIIVNGKLTSVRAVIKDQRPYVLLEQVTGEINKHFYYEEDTDRLLCTTASGVVSASRGKLYKDAVIFYEDETLKETTSLLTDRIYVQLDYVCQYTDILVDYYTGPARVFIRSKFGEVGSAIANSGACIRTEASSEGLVISKLSGGEELWVVSRDATWSLVYAGDELGYSGYMLNDEMDEYRMVNVASPGSQEEYSYYTSQEQICLVWHQVLNDSGVNALDNLLEATLGANVVSPTWFSVVSSDGTIQSRANADYIRIAKEHGMQVWALVENFNTSNQLDYDQLFGTEKARTNMINTLIDQALSYDIDGINVDFEGLPTDAGEGYLQFMGELSVACHEKGLVLSVDCYVPSSWTEHYHRDTLAEMVDYLIVMAYDEHYDGSEAGSTASLDFVHSAIEDTLDEKVPAERLIVALPFYSRLWKGDGVSLSSTTINMSDMKRYIDTYSPTWDYSLGQYYFERTIDGVLNRLWIEDGRSLTEKLDVVADYDVAGIAGWKLGMDNREAWSAISDYLNK